MKNLIIFIIVLVLMEGCCAQKLPRNQIEKSHIDEVRFYSRPLTQDEITVIRELNDIHAQIIQAKKLGLQRIYLIGGIYEGMAQEESKWSYPLSSIVYLLGQDGYQCDLYYHNTYGLIEKNRVDIGLRVSWNEIDDTGNVY